MVGVLLMVLSVFLRVFASLRETSPRNPGNRNFGTRLGVSLVLGAVVFIRAFMGGEPRGWDWQGRRPSSMPVPLGPARGWGCLLRHGTLAKARRREE